MSHWYNKDGAPCYTQIMKDGRERPTTLRDARKQQLVPSVTTIFDVMAKPGLDRWKTEQLLEAAAWSPFDQEKDLYDVFGELKNWKRDIVTESKKEGEEAAKKGTQIHDALELYYQTGKVKRGYKKYIEAVEECLSCLPDVKWIAEDSFCDSRGFGGKVDLHSKDDYGFIIDFKTKKTIDKAAVYDEHAMQLAAYSRGLGIPDAHCFNLFISYDEEDGKVRTELIDHTEGAIERGWQMFECLLNFWQLQKRYVPEL